MGKSEISMRCNQCRSSVFGLRSRVFGVGRPVVVDCPDRHIEYLCKVRALLYAESAKCVDPQPDIKGL